MLLDGVDLRQLSDQVLRHEVILITQENFLFTGSIADNIELGKPGASRAEIVAAADGDRRATRSSPSCRTATTSRSARAAAGCRPASASSSRSPGPSWPRRRVLVLDEATSLLDIPSERLVQDALHTILAGRTAVIIAHRLSTVAIADRVLVLGHGQIIEDGSPGELLDDRRRVLGPARRLAGEPRLTRPLSARPRPLTHRVGRRQPLIVTVLP